MKNTKYYLLLLLLLVSACATKQISNSSSDEIPIACRTNCASPFGKELGSTKEGIKAYSNCSAKCVYEKPSMINGAFAGIEWQCVEFARRWLMINKGLTFSSIDVAADLWGKIDSLIDIKTQKGTPLEHFINGSTSQPKTGDLLIYGREYENTGHVAIVLGVDNKHKSVRVGEQNYLNQTWGKKFAREISFIKKQNKYWLLDAHLIGWSRYYR